MTPAAHRVVRYGANVILWLDGITLGLLALSLAGWADTILSLIRQHAMELRARLPIAVFGICVVLAVVLILATALALVFGVPLGIFFLLWQGWLLLAPSAAPHPGYWAFSGGFVICCVVFDMFFGILHLKE